MNLAFRTFAFSILLTGLSVACLARAQADPPTKIVNKNWPESFYQQVSASTTAPGQSQFTNALFDSGDNSPLFGDDFDTTNTFPIQINREIYPNFDLLGTVTAVDRIMLYDETPLVGIAGALAQANELIPFPFANLSFNVRGSMEFRDIRQITPDQAKVVAIENRTPEIDQKEINPYLHSSKLSMLDSTKIPFKIPLSRGNIRHMRVGEIISYTLSGQVGFGASVGVKLLPSDVMSAGASLLLETYLIGSFQVSIMKESDRFAKVSISRLHGHEKDTELQAGIAFINFVNGFFVFKNNFINNIAESTSENIVPFQFQLLSEKDKEISVAYRYDLDSAEGSDSFHHAVLGSFKQSDEASSGVSKLFSRISLINTQQKLKTLDLSFLLNLQHGQKNQTTTTEITSDAGTEHLVQGVSENRNESHFINGKNEETMRKFTILIDREGFLNRKSHSLILTNENIIENTHTHGNELNRYTKIVEKTLKTPNLFPQFPETAPDPKHPEKLKKISYRKSYFYFGYSTDEAGLFQFLQLAPQSLLSEASAMGISFNLKAFADAKTALDTRNPDMLYVALDTLLGDRKHIQEISELFYSHIDKSGYEKFLVAQNQSFGSIQDRGSALLALEQNLQSAQTDELTHFDPNARVMNLTSEAGADQKIKIHFTLSASPQFLYFQVAPINKDANRNLVEMIVYNRGQRFKAGENTLTLDPNSSDDLERALCAKLNAHVKVFFTLGFKQSGLVWGNGASTQFETNDFYGEPNINSAI